MRVPRPLTAPEQAQAKQLWPRMNVGAVIVTDNATPRYNCLAWTLGISTSWIWPWAKGNVSKAHFDNLYRSHGFTPSGSGPVAVFGLNQNAMTHGSISGPGHGPRWESKCGAWLRIQHGLAEMEGGVLYGNVLGFNSKYGSGNINERLQTMKNEKLSQSDAKFLKARVQKVSPELKKRFEKLYQAWKEDLNHPLISVNSNPVARTQTTSFLELIALAPEIIPLLMEKLLDPAEFFALQAVDRLIRPEFVVCQEADEPAVLFGEQGRAIETVKQWIRTEA